MNDSTDLRNRILQMREANNLNLVSEKSEHVDENIIPENNVINHKENIKSTVTNEILTQETDDKDQLLLNKKKSLDNETLSNNSNKENSINFTDSNEIKLSSSYKSSSKLVSRFFICKSPKELNPLNISE